jgi:ribonuclease E
MNDEQKRPDDAAGEDQGGTSGEGSTGGAAPKRRSRARRGKRADTKAATAQVEASPEPAPEPVEVEPEAQAAPAPVEEGDEERPKRRRRRGGRGGTGGGAVGGEGRGRSGRGERSDDRREARPALPTVKREMVINYVPGEECRVAVLEEGKLEEFHSEKADAVSHVGNIYLGKVVNVEPAIQAAFVDFGLEQAAFLHVSDLHPRYFPGEDGETTEQVGKKVPRRDRPPIQACLRRGQEIVVQVLKEGVGTKGPTVTSYLSIPGRFLVMMPLMDRVGVSRKVEDEDTRRQMRQILDQLDLPDGFGFVLRTAGMDRNKTELKRDLAYLLRLWKDMEKRWKQGSAPRLLYAESDLLVRALRDMLAGDIERIVVDNEAALTRASKFLKIVAPRTAAGLVHYTGRVPLFHAVGVEPQIRNIHAREVPLPSGGRLVIDETEALVAIDVNSGKSRDAGDSETNAYNTNMEAAEEICRQLRLRDVGGIIINDLIDMRSAKHRREVENRFKDLLKKDRAKSTLETISDFGILEMTRQRMRGSQESLHFSGCPTCRGRGLVQKSESVASDALRELATMLEHSRVWRVEMVVSPRIAGELLSTKRRALNRLERTAGKRIDVRISEAIPVDRVAFYAYDDRGADIDVDKLSVPQVDPSQLVPWEKDLKLDDWTVDADAEGKAVQASEPAETDAPAGADQADFLSSTDFDDLETPIEVSGERSGLPGLTGEAGRGRRGRRGRGRSGRDDAGAGQGQGQNQGRRSEQPPPRREPVPTPAHAEEGAPVHADDEHAGGGEPRQSGGDGDSDQPGGGKRRRRRRRRRGRGGRGGEGQPGGQGGDESRPMDGDAEHARSGEFDDGPRNDDDRGGERPDAEHADDLGHARAERRDEGDEHHHADDDARDQRDGEEVGPDDRSEQDDRGPSGGGEQSDDGTGEGGRRRRRRRRRRGRGGRGGPNGEGGEPGAGPGPGSAPGEAREARPPRPEGERRDDRPERGPDNRRDDRRDGRREGGGRDDRRDQRGDDRRDRPQGQSRGGERPAQRPAPTPEPPPAPPPAEPKPRTLYGFRRKLAPSERYKLNQE